MNEPLDQPLERDLHAFADGRLSDAEAGRVDAWLAAHPEAAERVRDWQRQSELLHQAFDPLAEEAIPDRWRARIEGASTWRRCLPLATAASWVAIGAFLGFLVGRDSSSAPITVSGNYFPRQAAIAHVVYTPEVRHPVEVGADQEDHLVQWLSKRVGQPLRVPGLSNHGFSLVGGRLLPGDSGPVAQFMYQDSTGLRLTMYVSRPDPTEGETSFRFAEESGIGVFYWIDRRFAYALAGSVPREQLLSVAEAAYRQLDHVASTN